ncbi:MAG: cytochrome c biogenesis protein CcdA [Acidimicrobiales bacterium]
MLSRWATLRFVVVDPGSVLCQTASSSEVRWSPRWWRLGVYSLGAFSGVASSCCAPVLAGVIALSGLAPSLGVALGLGSAYVFGMVAPLFLVSLLWERRDWRSGRLFRPRSFNWRIGPLRRTIGGTNLATGLLLLLMGGGTLWAGLTVCHARVLRVAGPPVRRPPASRQGGH